MTTNIKSVWIQVKNFNPSKNRLEFINQTAYTMWYGCHMLGIKTFYFKEEMFDNIILRKEDVVHGYISIARKAFDKLGVSQPNIDGFPPDSIIPFYGRKMWITSMKEIRQNIDQKIFIKPLNKHKLFTGHVLKGDVATLIQTASIDDSEQLIASEIVNFESEYRLFVHNGIIIGCHHYRGNFTKSPNFDIAQEIVKSYKNAPVAYSLDLGVTDKGETLIVEINDAFSLGSCGMAPIPYTKMVLDRWEEIVGLS